MNRPRARDGYSRNTRGSPSNFRSRQSHHDHRHDGTSTVAPSVSKDRFSPINGSGLQGQSSPDNAISNNWTQSEGSAGIEQSSNVGSHQRHHDNVSIPNCSTHRQDGASVVSMVPFSCIRGPLQGPTSQENAVGNSLKHIKGSDGIERPSNILRHQHGQKSTGWTPIPKSSEPKLPIVDSPNQKKESVLASGSENKKYQSSKIKRPQHGQNGSEISVGEESSEHPTFLPLVSSSTPPDESSFRVARKDILSKTGRPHSGPNLPGRERTTGGSPVKLKASLLTKNREISPASMKFDICEFKSGTPVKLKASLLTKNRERRKELSRAENGSQRPRLRSGMVLLKNYISHPDQIKIIKVCQNLGLGDGGFYQPGYSDGGKMHLQMMCLGKNWDPETKLYQDRRKIDGAIPPSIPDEFKKLVEVAIKSSHAFIKEELKERNPEEILPSMQPDICIINFYTESGKLGLHQDKDESKESLSKQLPVVSFSLGDSAEFVYADQRDVEKPDKVRLESGDVLIFGGEARHIFHGVPSIIPGSAPKFLVDEANLRPGRLNLTFRQY